MVTKRHPLKSLTDLIWGVTESGTISSKYLSSEGITVLCRYNMGVHPAPSTSKQKRKQWKSRLKDFTIDFTVNQIPREGPEGPQTEKAKGDKTQLSILMQTRLSGPDNVPSRATLVSSNFSQVPKAFKAPNYYLETRIHDSKTEMGFSSSCGNLFPPLSLLNFSLIY